MNINPFANRYPENMSNELIKELFVEEFVDVSNILNHNHHFIWGARGSGKSMLFRFIEASCYADTVKDLKQQSLIDCPVFPIYYKIASGTLRVSEFKLVDRNYAALLSEHVLIMSIVRLTLNRLKKFIDIEHEKIIDYVKKIGYVLFDIEIEKSMQCANKMVDMREQPLEWLDIVCEKEVQAIYSYLKNKYKEMEIGYKGAIVGYHDFLIPFFRLTKELIGIEDLVFYLLIDEAGRTFDFQQEIMNDWIACRNHDILSIKLTSVKIEYKTFYTRDKWLIQNTHDFSETELNIVHYSTNDYNKKIKEVIKKRFKAYGITVEDIEKFYPSDPSFLDIVDKERIKLRKEYEEHQSKETFSEYCSRRLMPRVFQFLSEKRLKPSYAGFTVLVATSSGIIRNFLEPSRMMYDAVMNQNSDSPIIEIPKEIQEQKISQYSKDFFENIRCISSDPQDTVILNKLENLIKALGLYFRERLLTPDLTEGRIFSFTIKQIEQLDYSEKRVLQLAEQNDYLQKSFYSGKNGKSVEEWYLLSRRLAPFFKLDPTALKGRVSFSSSDIKLAMTNPDAFVKTKIEKLRKPKETSRQMELFELYDQIVYAEEADEADEE